MIFSDFTMSRNITILDSGATPGPGGTLLATSSKSKLWTTRPRISSGDVLPRVLAGSTRLRISSPITLQTASDYKKVCMSGIAQDGPDLCDT